MKNQYHLYATLTQSVLAKISFLALIWAIFFNNLAAQKTEPSAEEAPCDVPTNTYDIVLSNGTYISTNYPAGVTWNNKKILIPDVNAVVHIDKNVNMEQCTVRLARNAKIVVENSSVLKTSNHTLFFGCTYLWDRVEVQSGSSIDFTDSEFKDANSVLDLLPGFSNAKFVMKQCTLKNNYVGITISDPNTNDNVVQQFTPKSFSGNNFIFESSLLNGQNAFAGIKMENCINAKIGLTTTGSAGSNKYTGVGIGIYCKSSNLLILGDKFYNCNIGIQSPFSQISVNNCFFGDNTIGIESLDGRNYVTISLCTFDLSSTFSAQKHVRVFYTNYYKPYINIKNNTFQSPTGVSIVEMQRSPNNSKGYVKNRITNNIVNGKSGVLFNISAPYGGTDEFPITGNIANINGTSSTHGIKVSGDSDGFNISNNELYYTATSVGYLAQSLPIYVEFLNGQNNKIENNIIDAPYAFFPEDGEYGALIKCAIHIDQAPNFQVCGNSTNNTYRGFHFSGNIDYCDFALNNIGFHYDGIDCHKMPGSPNTVLGQGVVGQNWHKNTWISDPNAYFKHSAMNTDYLWGNSPTIFRVDPNEPGNMPPGLTNNNTTSKVRPIDWFIAIPPTPPSLVENTECISPSLKKNEGLSYNEDLLIQNEYSAEYFPELWDMERSLVFKLESNEELLSDSATYNWYIANQSTSAGQYAYFDKLFKDAYNIPTNLQDSFDLLLVEIGILSDSLNLLDSIQGIDETSDDSAIRNFEEGLLLRYRTLNNLETQINSSINSYIETKLLDAEDWLDGLPDTAIYESNRKTLNDIRLKIALGFELDENDCGMLKYVADQCPLTGGLAVREAPNYLPSQYGLEYFNENKWEEQCAEQRMNIENLYHDNRVIIYPNPTRGNLTIRINDATDGEWKVFNSSGQIIAKGIISSNIFNIVFDEKSSTGIYNLSIYNSESAPIIKKFVIIH